MTQCNKWADELTEKFKQLIKPVFIPNQNRNHPLSKSKSDRMYFAPNELEYAERKDVCIIPSYVLFEAVNRSLAKQSKPREKLELFISKTKGVLTEI